MSESVSIPNTSYLSVRDVASEMKISEQRIRKLIRDGAIEAQMVGKQWVTTAEALSTFQRNLLKMGPPDQKRKAGSKPKIKALSFFSGAMGLDQGLEEAGIRVMLCCEFDKSSRSTILANHPNIGLIGDIWNYDAPTIREYAGLSSDEPIDVIVGGPPCQAFSTAGARRGFGDQRGNAFLRYIDILVELRPKYAVIENVRGLLSQPMVHRPHSDRRPDWSPGFDEAPGGALEYVLEILRSAGYSISFNLYNAANFGVPQSRERVILICSLETSEVPLLMPTHSNDTRWGLPAWRTVRDAFDGLEESDAHYVKFPEERLKFFRLLGPGQYWKHLPEGLHREALGNSLDSGGGKTGFLRRLSWEKPSCTLVTSPIMPATDICHPERDRPISIQEYKRLQQFPDSWILCGSLIEQYRQLGNAVPVGLGRAVGRAIKAHMAGRAKTPPKDFPFSRYRNTDHVSWMEVRMERKKSLGTVNEDRRLFES